MGDIDYDISVNQQKTKQKHSGGIKMRKLLAIVLSVAMVASLATCFTVNVSAEVLPLGTAVEVGRADSAPNVTDMKSLLNRLSTTIPVRQP